MGKRAAAAANPSPGALPLFPSSGGWRRERERGEAPHWEERRASVAGGGSAGWAEAWAPCRGSEGESYPLDSRAYTVRAAHVRAVSRGVAAATASLHAEFFDLACP